MLFATSRPTAGGLHAHAIAAIENACLDIKGKALGVPVYELFGGAVRDRMQVYWSRCGVLRARCADMFDGKVIDRPGGAHARRPQGRRPRGARARLQGGEDQRAGVRRQGRSAVRARA